MSTSKFSNPFMMKNPLSPLKGNAFIKAKMDAEAAGKSSFVVDGKNYPLKMETPLEMHESDKYKETYDKWLSYGDKGGSERDNVYRELEKMAKHVNPTGEKLPRPKKEKSVKDKKSPLDNHVFGHKEKSSVEVGSIEANNAATTMEAREEKSRKRADSIYKDIGGYKGFKKMVMKMQNGTATKEEIQAFTKAQDNKNKKKKK